MSARDAISTALEVGVGVITIMILWILLTIVVYGGFLLVWPVEPNDATPWMYVGVVAFPLLGYLAHLWVWGRRTRAT